MNILNLDLAIKTGWALWNKDHDSLFSGTIDFKGSRFEGGGMRFLRFANWLERMHKENPLEQVYYEEVRRHLSTDSAHVHGGLLAHLQTFCERNEIPYLGVPVQTIKKHITGKGNASKEAVIAAVIGKGYLPTDDNEADALAIHFYVKEFIYG